MEFIVNGNLWKLKFVPKASSFLKMSNGVRTIGVTDGNLKNVYVAMGLSPYMERKVMLHEMAHVHALEYDYYMDAQTEEIVCDFLSLFGPNIVYMVDDIMGFLARGIAK